jgi:hypothetical protein
MAGGKVSEKKEPVLQAQFDIWAIFLLSGIGIYFL